MFDSSQFDDLNKKAAEFEKIMKDLVNDTQLNRLTVVLEKASKQWEDQVNAMSVISNSIKRDLQEIALKEAGLTKTQYQTTRTYKDRVNALNQINKSLDAGSKILQEQFRLTQHQHLQDLSNIETIQKQYGSFRKDISSSLVGAVADVATAKAHLAGGHLTPQEEAKYWDMLVASNKKVTEYLNLHKAFTSKINELEAKKLDMGKQYSDIYTDINKKLAENKELQTEITTAMIAAQRVEEERLKAERKERLTNAINNIPGASGIAGFLNSLSVLKDAIMVVVGEFGLLATGLAAIALLLGALLIKAIKDAFDTFKELRKAGFDYAQSLQVQSISTRAFAGGPSAGVFGNQKDFAAATAAVATHLGSIYNVNQSLATEAARLVINYHVSADNAGKLVSQIQRLDHFSTATTTSTLRWTEAIARISGAPIGDVMNDVAQNSELMARYGVQGLKAFTQSVVQLRQMGVSMGTLENSANSMVDDFDGFLEKQAEIQTVLPNVNLDKVFYLEQTNAPIEQVGAALRDALKSGGLNNVSDLRFRSVQNMLSSALNIPLDQLQNLLSGKNLAPTATATQPQADQMIEGFNNGLKNSIGNLGLFDIALGAATNALTKHPTFLGAIAGTIPFVGPLLQAKIDGMTASRNADAATIENATTGKSSTNASTTNTPHMNDAVKILEKIAVLLETGMIINLDGEQLGKSLVNSNSRR